MVCLSDIVIINIKLILNCAHDQTLKILLWAHLLARSY